MLSSIFGIRQLMSHCMPRAQSRSVRHSLSKAWWALHVFGLAVAVLMLPAGMSAQLTQLRSVSAVAGDGTQGDSGDGGPATSALVYNPSGPTIDRAGNLYFADSVNGRIRKVTVSTGIITTVAGNGTLGFSGDGGSATNAELSYPSGVALDGSGNIFIADTGNSRVRKVTASTGIITTVAGNGTAGFSGDGAAATSAELNTPVSVAVDGSGDLFIAEVNNNRVRMVAATTGIITTAAGNGTYGYSGDGGQATNAAIDQPQGVAVDNAGNLYIADTQNSCIRKVAASSGTITTIAGTGTYGFSGDGGPAISAQLSIPGGVAVDSSGNVYIADTNNHRVREILASSGNITTVAGTGGIGLAGNGGLATSATFQIISGVAVSDADELYLTDYMMVRKVGPVAYLPTAIGSSTTQNVFLQTSTAEAITSFTVPVSEGNKQEYAVGTVTGCVVDGITSNPSGTICTVPITFSPGYPGLRSVPLQAVTSAGKSNIGLTGMGVGPLAAITPGTMSTIAGEINPPNCSAYSGPALLGPLCNPSAGAVDFAGNVYVAAFYSNTVSKIDTRGNITVIAGTGAGGLSGVGGPATSATFDRPSDVVVDPAGNIYFAVETAEQVLRIDAVTGILTSVAGNGNQGYSGDNDPATMASFNRPEGLAFDTQGNLYVEDQDNNLIRKINPAGIITTVAGNPASINQGLPAYGGDGGPATQANLALCCQGVYASYDSIGVDAAGNLYIGDSGHHVVRKVTTDGIIHTIAGNNAMGPGYSGDGGAATSAQLNWPMGITTDPAGDVYIADFSNNAIRRVEASTQIITTIAGNGTQGSAGSGLATQVSLNGPQKVTLDGEGNLYVADTKNNLVRETNVSNPTLIFVTPTAAGSTDTTDGPLGVSVLDIGNAALTIEPPATGTNPSISANFSLYSGETGACATLTTSSSPATLQQGSSCALEATFTPVDSGSITGSLVLTDNSLNAASPHATQTITLDGTATAPPGPQPVLTPASLGFGSITVGTTSAAQVATLSNTGGVPQGISSFGFFGPNASSFSQTNTCGNSLAAGASCTISITCSPSATGALTANLGANFPSPEPQESVALTCTGTAPAAPQFVSNVGTALAPQAVNVVFANAGTLNNIQVLTLGVAGLDFTSAPTGSTCATSIAYTVGQSCTVNVIFDPQRPGTRNGAVLLLDASGKTLGIAYLPGTGIGPQVIFDGGSQSVLGGGFSGPEGLALDGLGNLYVADQSNEQVKQIPVGCTSASCVKTLASGFMYPTGLSLDGAGNIFFTDFTNSNSSISSSSDNLVEEIPFGCTSASCLISLGSGFNLPDGVGVDTSGNVFVADWGNNAVKEIVAVNGVIPASPTINVLAGGFTGQTGPDGLVLDPSGNIYVADHDDGHALYEIPIAGGYSTLNTISSSFTAPEDATIDATGNIYVVDEITNAAYELPAVSGTLPTPPTVNTLASNFNSPEGVAVDALGNIYVADWGNQRVVKIDLSDAPSLSFPTATKVGTTETTDGALKVTLTNDGNAAMTFTGIAPSTNFTIDSATTTCSTSTPLAAGATCVVGVDFAPTAAGSLSGTLTLTDNALNATAATQSIPLSGNATAAGAPQAVLSPTSLTFTSTAGTASAAQTITLSNPGNASLTITGISIAGTNPTSFAQTNNCGTTLAASSSCTITVTFAPTAAGSYTAALSVTDAVGTQTSILTGNATPPPAPAAALTPTSANFGSLVAGTTSTAQTFTLTNSGNAPLTISGITLAGANASVFADTSACGSTLAASASCTISVTFTPSGAGSFSATLSVADNATGSPQTSALTGTGTVPPDFTIAATPAAQTVGPGGATAYSINVASTNGSFTNAVALTATGIPGATITFAPASVTPGSSGASSTMTVRTVTQDAKNSHRDWPFVAPVFAALLLLPNKKWRLRRVFMNLACLIALLGIAASSIGCGGGFALPAKTYTITVTGASGADTHSTTVTLTVQ